MQHDKDMNGVSSEGRGYPLLQMTTYYRIEAEHMHAMMSGRIRGKGDRRESNQK